MLSVPHVSRRAGRAGAAPASAVYIGFAAVLDAVGAVPVARIGAALVDRAVAVVVNAVAGLRGTGACTPDARREARAGARAAAPGRAGSRRAAAAGHAGPVVALRIAVVIHPVADFLHGCRGCLAGSVRVPVLPSIPADHGAVAGHAGRIGMLACPAYRLAAAAMVDIALGIEAAAVADDLPRGAFGQASPGAADLLRGARGAAAAAVCMVPRDVDADSGAEQEPPGALLITLGIGVERSGVSPAEVAG